MNIYFVDDDLKVTMLTGSIEVQSRIAFELSEAAEHKIGSMGAVTDDFKVKAMMSWSIYETNASQKVRRFIRKYMVLKALQDAPLADG